VSRWLLMLLLAGAAAPCGARDALQVIDDCLARIDAGLDVGYERIAARCPDLTPALTQSPWAPWLPSGWDNPKNELSAQGLSELRRLLSRALEKPLVAHQPRVERVHAILAGLKAQEQAQESWWTRFKAWLRGVLTPRAQADSGWLQRLFGRLPVSEAIVKVIVWCVLGAIVALAGVVVVNELRVAGLLRRRVRAAAAGSAVSAARAGTLDIEAANPRQQPGLLLDRIAARLGEQGRLPPARAFTALEVARAASLRDDGERARLTELARVSERARYSDEEIAPARLSGALLGGHELLAALETT
jgi:hypothetical protein